MNLVLGFFSKIGNFLAGLRKKKTTIERLEQLEKEIQVYEKFKQKNELNEKKYLGALLLYSIILYIIGAIVYYIYLMPKNLADRVKTLIPFFIIPLIILLIRKFLKWFYIKRTIHYEQKLIDLKEEKKSILEEVKEKETYKKAREILERFSNGVDIHITPPVTPSSNTSVYSATPFLNKTNMLENSNKNSSNNTLVHRNVRQLIQNQQSQSLNKSTPNILDTTRSTNSNKQQSDNLNQTTRALSNSNTSLASVSSIATSKTNLNQAGPQQLTDLPPPSNLAMNQARTLLPRPIIAPNRTIFDKLLDYIIGEGPNNRYALICKSCHFHNGMALKEEFEYVAFRCAYCLFYNEARKTKLTVPKFSTNNNQTSNFNESNLSLSNSFDENGTKSEPIASVTYTNQEKENNRKFEKRRKTSLTNSTQINSNLNYENGVTKKISKSTEKLDKNKADDENKENQLNSNDDTFNDNLDDDDEEEMVDDEIGKN